MREPRPGGLGECHTPEPRGEQRQRARVGGVGCKVPRTGNTHRSTDPGHARCLVPREPPSAASECQEIAAVHRERCAHGSGLLSKGRIKFTDTRESGRLSGALLKGKSEGLFLQARKRSSKGRCICQKVGRKNKQPTRTLTQESISIQHSNNCDNKCLICGLKKKTEIGR